MWMSSNFGTGNVSGSVRVMTKALLIGMMALALTACETVKDLVQEVPGTSSDAKVSFQSEPDIRVRVVGNASRKEVAGPAYVIVRQGGASAASVGSGVSDGVEAPAGRAVTLASPIVVIATGQGVRVTDSKNQVRTFAPGADVEILPGDERKDGIATGASRSLMLEGVRYPGFMTVKPRSDRADAFDVVVSMGVESYLPGVLSHELWKDWPRQTYETQAVAARTYALHERSRARAEGRGWDVEDTTADQVYGGVTLATTPNEATRATRGVVLSSGGKLLRAYYSSQCGGRPASARDVWPTKSGWEFNLAKPLQGKKREHYCQRSSLYRWEITRRDDDVNRRLRAWGTRTQNDVRGITKLRSIVVADKNDAERPNKYSLTDDRGREYELRAEELREALNEPVQGLPPIVKENRVNSGDLECEVWADQIRLRGRGWGHGVGMCQWCAKGMADAGMDWRQMVSTFYPGADVTRAY